MSRPRRYLDAADWTAVAEGQGSAAAGAPPPGARAWERERLLAKLDARKMAMFPTSSAPALPGLYESPADAERRRANERRRKVDRLLEDMGVRPRSTW